MTRRFALFIANLVLAFSAAAQVSDKAEESRSAPVRVYIVPMSDFPEQLAAEVARVLSQDLDFQIRSTLRIGDLNLTPLPSSRQFSADQILHESSSTLRSFPEVGPDTYFLLLTANDINSNTLGVQYLFSWHSPLLRASVLSVARFLEFRDGNPQTDSRFFDRLLKMSKRAIGELHLGWKRSTNVQDVMYSPLMSPQDIDRIGFNHIEPQAPK